jgi:hypothetical protein
MRIKLNTYYPNNPGVYGNNIFKIFLKRIDEKAK